MIRESFVEVHGFFIDDLHILAQLALRPFEHGVMTSEGIPL